MRSSLVEKEIRDVLEGALLSLDKAGIERLVKRLGKETGGTLRHVMDLYSKGISGPEPVPGRAKIRQEWDRAVSDWRDCVYESVYEEGKYVMQEHHWETPYLDTSALAGDLEEIAARMRALIPRVVDDNIDPEFDFFKFAVETVDEVGSGLPEWIDGWEEGYLFGNEGTRCLLEWTWRTMCAEKRPVKPFEFIDRVIEFESANNEINLEGDAVIEFVLALDEECQKEILAGIEGQIGQAAEAFPHLCGVGCRKPVNPRVA